MEATPTTHVVEDEDDIAGRTRFFFQFGGEEHAAHCHGEGIEEEDTGGFAWREDGGVLGGFGGQGAPVEEAVEEGLRGGHDDLGLS